jgi:hypothetical protein
MKKIALVLWMGLCLVCNRADASDDKGKDAAGEEPVASYSLKGKVYDPVCGEAIPGATVTVDGMKYYSDFAGNFFVSELRKGRHSIVVDFISYQSQTMDIDINTSREVNIELRQQ